MLKKFRWTFRLILLTPFLLIISIFLMGGGHGWFEPAMFLFPFGMIGVLVQDTISFPFIILAILQYPLYGFIIDKTKYRRYNKEVVISLVVGHILVAIMILSLRSDNWKQG